MNKLSYHIKGLNLNTTPARVNGEDSYLTSGSLHVKVSDVKYLKTEADICLSDLPSPLLYDLGKAIYNIDKHLNDQVEFIGCDEDLSIDGEGVKINGKTIIKF